jgi:hypothetical protein
MPDPLQISKNQETTTNSINSRYSGIQMVDSKVVDPNGSQTTDDRSFITGQNSWGTLWKMVKGNFLVRAYNNISLNASGDVHVTGHNKQETLTGDKGIYVKGKTQNLSGEQEDSHKEALSEYQTVVNEITKNSHDAMHNTQAERVACPICAQKHLVDDKSDNWATIFDYLNKICPGYLAGPFQAFRTVMNKVYIPFLSQKNTIGMNSGEGCGPGCENGMREGLSNKFQASQKAVEKGFKDNEDKLNKISEKLGNPSPVVQGHKDNEVQIYGLPGSGQEVSPYVQVKGQYNTIPTHFLVSPTQKNSLITKTKGSCPKIIFVPPTQIPTGALMFNIQNKFDIITGVGGTNIISTGEIALKGGSAHINGSQGEASITSNNLTTIGGKNVLITADDRSGDTGVMIQSKHTFVGGSLNVTGDVALKGHLTTDGALSVPYIIAPTQSAETTLAASSKYATEGANWVGVGLGLNTTNFVKDLATQFLLRPSFAMTVDGITKITMETFNLIMMARTLEWPVPTGIFWGVGAGFGVVEVQGFVWNFTHNHTLAGNSHTHQFDQVKGSYYKTLQGWGGQRTAGSPAPTPAPTHGDYPSPGPNAKGGGCGGGGLYTKARNTKYNLGDGDPFNGGNYVPVTINRNPDGSLNPSPYFSWTDTYPAPKITPGGTDPNTGNIIPITDTTIPSVSANC